MLHSSCEICSVSLRRWGDGISLAGQNVFADLVWDGNSAPFTPIFCILFQDSTNAFLLSFSIFSVLISCLWCVCQTAQWNSWVRLLARNFDWLQRKRGKECRELAENAVTLIQRKREAQSTAARLIYRKAKTWRSPVGVLGVGEIRGESARGCKNWILTMLDLIFRQCCVQGGNTEKTQMGLQHLKANTAIQFLLKKKKKLQR